MSATSRPAGRERRRRGEGRGGGLTDASSAPFRMMRSHWKPLDILPPEDLERVHEASMYILENIGIEFLEPAALELYERAGAKVVREAGGKVGKVWFDRGLIMEAIAKAPTSFRLHARNPERDVIIGDGHMVFATVTGPAYSTNLERGRRPGCQADADDFVRLAHSISVLHCVPGGSVASIDLPVETRHLTSMHRRTQLTDKAGLGSARGWVHARDAIEMTAIVHGGHAAIRERPALMSVINVNSPLRYDDTMLQGLLAYAWAGQPMVVTPFILAGAMGPITMAGSMALQNAEALAGIALMELANPGTPAVYGGFTTDTHMRSGNPSFGTPEAAWATLVGAQLARKYNLPYRTSGGLNSSPTMDAQAAYETMMSLWSAILGQANFMLHSAGWIEGGLTASYEKFVLDAEMLAMMDSLLHGFELSDETLALDSIAQVGPGGHHFDTALTMARYSSAFYNPLVFIRQSYENWTESGGQDATQRAYRKWKELLAQYEQPALDPAIDEALTDYVERRSREILSSRE